ncbi:MAG: hypothetical protein ABFE07_00435 [Armatimonadia bacterium]
MEKARAQLGDLAALTSKTEAAERRILERAEKRLTEVQAEIDKLHPGIHGASEQAQDEYLALITERGQLHTVIAKAQQALK